MRSTRHVRSGIGLAVVVLALLVGQAFGASQVKYTLEIKGDNHAADWKAGTEVVYTRGSAADDQKQFNGSLLDYAVVLEAAGVHSQPGHASDGYQIYGAANVVFNLELWSADENGQPTTLATDATFLSTINDGTAGDPSANAAFSLSFTPMGPSNPGRLIDTLTNGGPRMEPIFTYPTAQPGTLIGQGAGFKEWKRTGSSDVFTLAGVGMTLLPSGQAGLGVIPVAEGQIDMSNLPLGTYVLKVIPGNGNNVLRGDLAMTAATDRPAFAVAANETLGDSLVFELTDIPECNGVMARHLFYDNSYWDGNNPGFNDANPAQDYAAIAPDKTPLLPGGGSATFQNYTSFSKGITGIMVDACNFSRAPVWGMDLYCVMGNDLNDPFTWTDEAPAPSINVRPGEGAYGSDRLILTWPEGAIPNTRWLLVALFSADPTLGLPADDYFIFGLAKGEGSGDFTTTPTDEIGARTNPHTPLNRAPIDDVWDFNRDSLVSPTDQVIARTNPTTPLNRLKAISW